MRKWIMVLVVMAFMGFAIGTVNAGPGPAPNSGDGIPDGSGWSDGQPGPFGPGSE